MLSTPRRANFQVNRKTISELVQLEVGNAKERDFLLILYQFIYDAVQVTMNGMEIEIITLKYRIAPIPKSHFNVG